MIERRSPMDKELGTIRVSETDKGLKIEIEGDLKERFGNCGCMPIVACCCNQTDGCCTDEKKC